MRVWSLSIVLSNFYPRPPRGGRPAATKPPPFRWRFLSTPSARRATALRCWHSFEFHISIHALREEGDRYNNRMPRRAGDFYPRPPRGGRPALVRFAKAQLDFYPRPPRGGRPSSPGRTPVDTEFLSTPSARRATRCELGLTDEQVQFLSTPSARRATSGDRLFDHAGEISIHALREEGDGQGSRGCPASIYFYPRPPRGGRLYGIIQQLQHDIHFYPRPPRGGRPCRS